MGNVLSCNQNKQEVDSNNVESPVDHNEESDSIDKIPFRSISVLTMTTSKKYEVAPGRSDLTEFSSVDWASLIDFDKTQPSSLFSSKRKHNLSPLLTESPLQEQQSWLEADSFTQHEKRMSAQSPTEIFPSLFLGSKLDSMKDARLKELKVTHILSVTSGTQHSVPGCKLLTVAMADNGNSCLFDVMNRSFGFIEESQQDGNKLLIHCHLGQNRSPTVVIAWLMTECKMNMHDAYLFVKAKRNIIHPNKLYIQQLREYEKQLYGVYSVLPDFLSVTYSDGELKISHEDWTSVQSLAYRESQKNEHSISSKSNTQNNEHSSASKSDENSVSKESKPEIKVEKQSYGDVHRKSESVFLNKEAFLNSSIFFLPMSPAGDQGFTHVTRSTTVDSSKTKSILSVGDDPLVNSHEDRKNKRDAEVSFVYSLGTVPDPSETSSSG